MFDERSCDKCNGKEYKVLIGASVHGSILHPGVAANEDHWFCPDCSWGADGPGDEAA